MDDRVTSIDLAEVVAAVAGVSAVFRATAVDAGAFEVTIAVDEEWAAPDVCRLVHDTIAEYLLRATGEPPRSIAVAVGRIG